MAEQQGFDFDPLIHGQPPPVVPLRPGVERSEQAPRGTPRPPQPPPVTPHQAVEGLPGAALIDFAKVIRTVIATRILLLLAIVVASFIWGVCSWQPSELRIAAAAVYSLLVLWPLVWLFFRKG